MALGRAKNRKALAFLLELAQSTNGSRGLIMALGDLNDPAAIPVLIHFLKIVGKKEPYKPSYGLSDEFSRPVFALGQLKAKEAVPVLLEYLAYPQVIESLERIGDPAAVQPLRDLEQVAQVVGGRRQDGSEAEVSLSLPECFGLRQSIFDRPPPPPGPAASPWTRLERAVRGGMMGGVIDGSNGAGM